MSHNPTSKEYSMPSQESEAVSPNLLWLAAICQVFSEKKKKSGNVCESRIWDFSPSNTETTPLEI